MRESLKNKDCYILRLNEVLRNNFTADEFYVCIVLCIFIASIAVAVQIWNQREKYVPCDLYERWIFYFKSNFNGHTWSSVFELEFNRTSELLFPENFN